MTFIAAMLLAAVFSADFPSAADWARAESLIVRLPPSAFPKLPAAIRLDLERHGYRIPQPDMGELLTGSPTRPGNAVRGQFDGVDGQDWAVLASKDGASAILVFWGGSTARVDTLKRREDYGYLQGLGPGRIGFSRGITVANVRVMRGYYKVWGEGAQPPVPLEHDGIEDHFIEKASSVLYYRRGVWHRLIGSD